MSRREDTRTNPEMPKRTTPITQTPDADPTLKLKRTHSLPARVRTIRHSSAVSETTVKNQNHSFAQFSQRGRSYSHNDSAKKGIPESKVELVGPPEIGESTRKGKGKNNICVDNGGPTEILYDATNVARLDSASIRSSTAAHHEGKAMALEAKSAELCTSDKGSNHGDILSFGKTASEDSQALEPPEQAEQVIRDDPLGVEPLLPELMEDILGRLGSAREVIQMRTELGKALRNAIHRPTFRRNRPKSEGEFSPTFIMADDEGVMHFYGFDTKFRTWATLPPLNFSKKILISPDPDLFKDYLVAGDGGLFCMNVGKAPDREKLVMCNPLTQQVKVLPPLTYARHPVLMHLIVDQDSGHYKVFVAGSAAIGTTEELSLKTEEYESRTGVWECPDGSDLPCPPFGLNEYQNGVYFKDSKRELLMCVAIVDTRGRGVLVYDIKKKQWAQGHMKLYIPRVQIEPNDSHELATTQIVECSGSVFVFSRQERGWDDVYLVIHKLIPASSGDFTWAEVMLRKLPLGGGLLEYPEYICGPVSEHELCIFNTVEHTTEIINLRNSMEVTPLIPAPTSKGKRVCSLNPIGIMFTPSFRSGVCPRGEGSPKLRCDLNLPEYCSECERRKLESRIRSGVPKNECPKFINSTQAGCEVVTAPITEEIDTTINPGVEAGSWSVEKLILDYVGKVLEVVRNFARSIAGA